MIFLDLAWQHEAFLDEPRIALDLAQKYDANPDITAFDNRIVFRGQEKTLTTTNRQNKYLDAWQKIISNDLDSVALGNQNLLQKEQFNLIQPVYDVFLGLPSSFIGFLVFKNSLLAHGSPFVGNIHPYHRDFVESKPGGNILLRDNRWAWITEPGGMYAKWAQAISPTIRMTPDVRQHLVTTTLSDDIGHKWPIDDQNLLSGAP
jgi:hypothetical protein